jgi:AcrR family transcriptional regulator
MLELPDPSLLNTLSHSQQEVLRGLVAGRSISASARAAGVHRATVYLWIRTVPAFNRALDAHRRLRADRIADDLNDLADSALQALRQILDNTESPAAVRYKAAIDIISLAQRHEEGRLYRDSNLLSEFHTELDAEVGNPPAPEPPPSALQQPALYAEAVATPNEAIRPGPVRPSPVRNAPCPCGSRLKYKRCCGKLPQQALAA